MELKAIVMDIDGTLLNKEKLFQHVLKNKLIEAQRRHKNCFSFR